MRRAGLAAGLVVALLGSAPLVARADEGIARRLHALRVLAPRDGEASAALPEGPAASHADCASGAWWEASAYAVRARTRQAIQDAALRFAVDESLIRSVIRHESAYEIRAVSHKGAMGLMQLMPATARELGVACAFDPRENVLGGTRYLRQLYDRLGSWPRAVAAYHAGPSRVERGRIPGETRTYVRRVITTWRPHQDYALD